MIQKNKEVIKLHWTYPRTYGLMLLPWEKFGFTRSNNENKSRAKPNGDFRVGANRNEKIVLQI